MKLEGDLMFYVLAGIVAICIVLLDALRRNNGNEPTPPDLDRLTDRERIAAMRKKQEAGRERMKALGIKSLNDGREAWACINPMGRKDAPPKNSVVSMKRRA